VLLTKFRKNFICNWDSSVGIVTKLWTKQQRNRGWILDKEILISMESIQDIDSWVEPIHIKKSLV
jgi:hypothetical protein